MVNSVQQNFREKIFVLSDFICMFKMSFCFFGTPCSSKIKCVRAKKLEGEAFKAPPPDRIGLTLYIFDINIFNTWAYAGFAKGG